MTKMSIKYSKENFTPQREKLLKCSSMTTSLIEKIIKGVNYESQFTPFITVFFLSDSKSDKKRTCDNKMKMKLETLW